MISPAEQELLKSIAHKLTKYPELEDDMQILQFMGGLKPVIRAKGRWNRVLIFLRDRFRCVYCGARFENAEGLTTDHVLPTSRGGTDDPSNLVSCCLSCNSAKNNRTPGEWFSDNGAGWRVLRSSGGEKSSTALRMARMRLRKKMPVFERDGFKCQRCGDTFSPERGRVVYVRSLRQGGKDELDNKSSRCPSCT